MTRIRFLPQRFSAQRMCGTTGCVMAGWVGDGVAERPVQHSFFGGGRSLWWVFEGTIRTNNSFNFLRSFFFLHYHLANKQQSHAKGISWLSNVWGGTVSDASKYCRWLCSRASCYQISSNEALTKAKKASNCRSWNAPGNSQAPLLTLRKRGETAL